LEVAVAVAEEMYQAQPTLEVLVAVPVDLELVQAKQ
jgi:hypothetical protein